ncbi:MAG: hypothetical protein KHZ78_03595 [Peptoniphilus sp. oral taxon 375]|nr:hypothetical protein [Peptoniphilus sp. oral taxon 375]
MKKLFPILAILSLLVLVACQPQASSEGAGEKPEISQERILADLKEADEKDNPYKRDDYIAYSLTMVKEVEEGQKTSVLLWVWSQGYSFSQGIFKAESGYSMPMKLVYGSQDEKLQEIIQPRDGSEYAPSVLEMAGGDKELADSLMERPDSQKDYDQLMESLAQDAKSKGLEGFSHKIDQIPGYEEDVVYIKTGPNHIPGTVEIAKKADYDQAKARLGTENWTYCPSILYHEKTGLALESIIDSFED